MEDKEIIALYFARSENAISETALKYGGYCCYISENILHNREDAEECCSDAYFDAWQSIPPHNPQNLKTFLGKLTRNRAIKKLEHCQAAKRGGGQINLILSELDECLPSGSNVEEKLQESVLLECINSYLLSLPALHRKVFVRRYWYTSPISDIARQYAMSESKVKSLLFRLRKQLKAKLEKEGFFL